MELIGVMTAAAGRMARIHPGPSSDLRSNKEKQTWVIREKKDKGKKEQQKKAQLNPKEKRQLKKTKKK